MKNFFAIVQAIVDLGLLVGGPAYLYGKWKNGIRIADKEEDDITDGTIRRLEAGIHARELENAGLQGDIKKLTAENDAQKILNQGFFDKAINKELLEKMMESLIALNNAVTNTFIPAAKKIDDIHDIIVNGATIKSKEAEK